MGFPKSCHLGFPYLKYAIQSQNDIIYSFTGLRRGVVIPLSQVCRLEYPYFVKSPSAPVFSAGAAPDRPRAQRLATAAAAGGHAKVQFRDPRRA